MKHETRLSCWKQLSNTPIIDKIATICSHSLNKFDQAIEGWIENIQSLSYSTSEENLIHLINHQEQTILKALKTIENLYIIPSTSTHTKFYKSKSLRNKSYSGFGKFKIFEVSTKSVSNFQVPKTITKKTKTKPVYEQKRTEFYDDKIMNYLNRKNNKECDEKIEEFKEQINHKINNIVEMLKEKSSKKENAPPSNEIPQKHQSQAINEVVEGKNEEKCLTVKKEENSLPLTHKSDKKSTILKKQSKIGKKMQMIKENEIQDLETHQITHQKIKQKQRQLQKKEQMFKQFVAMNDKVQIPANRTLNHIFDKYYKDQCKSNQIQYKSLTDNKLAEVASPLQQLKNSLQMLAKLLKSKLEEKKKKKVEKYVEKCLSCTEMLVLKRERGDGNLSSRIENIISQL